MATRILIVDDSAMFRRGLRDAIEVNREWEVCGEAVDGQEAVEKTRLLTPQLIVMDLSMPRMAGIEAASEILKEFPKVPILLLTLHFTNQLAEAAHAAGIRAVMSKAAMDHLADGIHALLRGESFTPSVN
jgi:DNA-binding NarL/FixJ family response regulator